MVRKTFSYYIKIAKKKLNNKEYDNAILYYDKAIELHPYFSSTFNERGYCKAKKFNYTAALEDYTAAIRRNEREPQYFVNRGIAYFKLGKINEAIKDFETASLLGSREAKKILSKVGYYKEDWQEFEKIISTEEIDVLYHFTDRANLISIEQYGGLYSWYSCKIKGIEIPLPNSNNLSRDLDKEKNIHDYVRLTFNRNHPMLYVAKKKGRIKNPCFLEISTEVILFKETLFSNENAVANAAIIGGKLEDFRRIKFNFAKSGKWYNEKEKKFIQAEVLVKSHIPIKFIKNIDKV